QVSAPVATTEQPATTATTEVTPANTASEPVATEQPEQPVSNGASTHVANRKPTTDRRLKVTPDAAIGIRVGAPANANGQRAESSKNSERTSTDPAATKPKSNTTENSQVAPAKQTAPASKAKVIPWP